MAEFGGGEGIYAVARQLRERCLMANGSLLSDDENVWTADGLKAIHKAVIVEEIRDKSLSFMEKYKTQVGSQTSAVIRLAAELLYVYFLFPAKVSQQLKSGRVKEVLSWGGLTAPEQVFDVFRAGIGGAGQGYNTRRPLEIGYLCQAALAFKKADAAALDDPWQVKDLLETVEPDENRQIKHMLLHMLFPDQFERIASGGHKRRILSAFSALVDDEARALDDEDRQLLAVRARLKRFLPGRPLDFYEAPLSQAWYGDSDDGQPGIGLEGILYKKQVVLYGPPGTGKTFTANVLAERIIRAEALKQLPIERYFGMEPKWPEILKSRIHWLQLHPSFGYEDFVRGLHIASNGRTEHRPGFLLRLVDRMRAETGELAKLPHVLVLDEMNRTDLARMLGECFSLLENRDKAVNLPAQDESGTSLTLSLPENLYVIGTMNLIDQSVEQIDFALRRRFLWQLCPFSKEQFVEAAEHRWSRSAPVVPWDRVAEDFDRLALAAQAVNRRIAEHELLGPQYEIGHTYLLDVVSFLQPGLTRDSKVFLWSGGAKAPAREPLHQLWALSLRPLISEYLAGVDSKARETELGKLEKVFLARPAAE
jgi:5-methylcytosine-specific restriction enzyme B